MTNDNVPGEPSRVPSALTVKRSRQPGYSDAAIRACLTMNVLLGMALKQTTGFFESLLRLIGLDWAVPNFSTLSRRQKALKVDILYRGSASKSLIQNYPSIFIPLQDDV